MNSILTKEECIRILRLYSHWNTSQQGYTDEESELFDERRKLIISATKQLLSTGTPENGVEIIAIERARQKVSEGYTEGHDDAHVAGELAVAGAFYAMESTGIDHGLDWPFDENFPREKGHSRLRQLQIAGALIAAEIDRRLRFGDKL